MARGRIRMRTAIRGLLVLCGIVAAVRAETVTYECAPDPEAGLIRVSITWVVGKRESSILQINPSAGSIQDVPSLLKNLAFEGAEAVVQEGANWQISHRPNVTLHVEYVVKPRQRNLDWEKTQLPVTNNRFFHGLGRTFLLTPQAGGGLPAEYEFIFRWKLPERWKAVCSWGGAAPTVGAKLTPADIRESVYFAGTLKLASRRDVGRSVTLAFIDEFDFTADSFLDTATRIIAHQAAFTRETRFPDFLITAVPVGEPVKPGDARLVGVGLYHSFALWLAPRSQLSDALENLFAHELFHFWNGRILRAAEPDKLCYWFSEGMTDYYAFRILHESGDWTPQTYCKWINRQLREYAHNPAIRATNEDIARDYWPKRNTVGEVAYQRGALLGLRWHQLARQKGVKGGLDRWFFALLDQARKNPDSEYRNADLKAAGVRELGPWFAGEFERFVENCEPVDVPREALGERFVGKVTSTYDFAPGFDVDRSRSQRKVIGLHPGSSAAKAGLREGDELLALRIQPDPALESALRIRRDGQERELRYFARGERRELLQFEAR